MRNLEVDVGGRKVVVAIGNGTSSLLGEVSGKKLIVRSKNVKSPLEAEIEVVIEDGEESKTLDSTLNLVRAMRRAGLGRSDFVVAVGGGSVLDVAGFAASIYLRGIGLINVPTTLLGMVDAGLGGKNGINFEGLKNVLGTFYQPSMVIDDLSFLTTLPYDDFINGMAEVVKYGVTLDKEFYDFLSIKVEDVKSRNESVVEEIVYRSVENKMRIVAEDELDIKEVRIVLNFGHTVGHAIEAGTRFAVPHGKAVAVGMVCEAKIAEELGVAEEGVVEDVLWILQLYGLPITPAQLGLPVDMELVERAIHGDKKIKGEEIVMAVPVRIGSWTKFKVSVETLRGLVRQCLE
ncbi:3-dehydroquinate synthase [Sulfodiicoccus acidiphilus]|uniref:3-dehydroquinate synthase n=1 Tax=Sulfodiicoccus acidiphilus TaxID=1670455 RepID=A0A348B107_9CREN|nr:3-dehydroquinate synthase [Sulfodiicoccus acidiphilus]BBD71859.1 3-dehydroquinate synthase [Sulfodiicoccus acidiphilus]GGU02491.1 3-dehydroquinate synthase [Sulfodiicoccus acidiphilus]